MSRSAAHCERHRLGLSGEDMVVGVDQLDQHLVLAGSVVGLKNPVHLPRKVVCFTAAEGPLFFPP